MIKLFYIIVNGQEIDLLEQNGDFAMANAQYRAMQDNTQVKLFYRGIKVKGTDLRLGTFEANGEFYPSEYFDNNPKVI